LTEKLNFTRADVLTKLWDIARWHEDKRVNPRAKLDENAKERSAFSGKEIRALQTILQGLADQELETRVKELEEKLANGILIPKPKEVYVK
jgi:transcription elongation GreA/GreB family factor